MGHVDDLRSFLTGNDREVEGVFDVVLTTDHDALIGAETCTGGDEVTADEGFPSSPEGGCTVVVCTRLWYPWCFL